MIGVDAGEGRIMTVYFFDSSALVKRYRYETGSERVSDLFDSAERLTLSRLAQAEVIAAIVRRSRAAGAPEDGLRGVVAVFSRELEELFEIVELDAPVIEKAAALALKHGLRGADAVQLACALLARNDATQQEFTFVGSDHELNVAAEAEGLAVIDPTVA